MKTYNVTLYYLVSCTHEVEAENDNQALEMASQKHVSDQSMNEEDLLFSKDDVPTNIEPVIEEQKEED